MGKYPRTVEKVVHLIDIQFRKNQMYEKFRVL